MKENEENAYEKTYNSMVKRGLSAKAKVVYMVLVGLADENGVCSTTRKTLLYECRFSKENLDKGLKELISAGIVSREKGKFKKNVYTLHDAE